MVECQIFVSGRSGIASIVNFADSANIETGKF